MQYTKIKNKSLQNVMCMPHIQPGMKIGLFGGTFDPPHYGHIAIANIALTKLGLDQLWWIITPSHSFKDYSSQPSLSERIALSTKLVKNPYIHITAFEASHNYTHTFNTICQVKSRSKSVQFVWIMGADNIKTFHQWHHWKRLVRTVPIAIIDRFDTTLNYISSPMAKAFNYARLDESLSNTLCNKSPPAWIFIHNRHYIISSTILRKQKIHKNNFA
ncbi:MAG: nicotinate-nucleotide adenylyltransferase [Candidatus Liberibacter ctenarytainae]|uniref:Probable nicotinate-nucleotide adenylyltransferase n=1 Tax=Candidatus Liberibacter ctenarytainae TaxID=2020335 RepID=A0A937DJ11_9HYPH|nr:nicotinate-nucleotide adenylyltransferase [Candidatus Liberibacter ctenarytainae]